MTGEEQRVLNECREMTIDGLLFQLSGLAREGALVEADDIWRLEVIGGRLISSYEMTHPGTKLAHIRDDFISGLRRNAKRVAG